MRFAHRLCLAMRDPHVLRRLTAREFQRWMWYEEIEPFGELREDYRTAHIVAMIHNTSVGSEHQKPLEDFLLKFEPKKAKSADHLELMMRIWAGVDKMPPRT